MSGASPDMPTLLADLRAEHDDLAELVGGADLRQPTPAQGWDIGDAVAHLRGTDVEARRAATRPAEFAAGLPAVAQDLQGFLQAQLDQGRAMGETELLRDWSLGFARMLEALADLPPGVAVPWYGPPMSPASFATARLMEYWAHGQDVADALEVDRPPTARLRHVCHLGVRTRGFSYVVRGLDVPPGDVRVELTAPDGGTWSWGTGPDTVRGPALDFCLLVTQRRHRSDLSLVVHGDAADRWLDVAQCFAGPPGSGRPPAAAAGRS